MAKPNITPERIRELLSYNPETGVLIRKVTTSNRSLAGSVAGRNNGNGYLRMTLDKETLYAHRVAWAHFYGVHPDHEIDHIDGDRRNNRISNLRSATHAENLQNQKLLRVSNTSGRCGVSWSKQKSCWEAYITVNGRKVSLGLFADIDEAANAYLRAKQKNHEFQPIPRDLLDA